MGWNSAEKLQSFVREIQFEENLSWIIFLGVLICQKTQSNCQIVWKEQKRFGWCPLRSPHFTPIRYQKNYISVNDRIQKTISSQCNLTAQIEHTHIYIYIIHLVVIDPFKYNMCLLYLRELHIICLYISLLEHICSQLLFEDCHLIIWYVLVNC